MSNVIMFYNGEGANVVQGGIGHRVLKYMKIKDNLH